MRRYTHEVVQPRLARELAQMPSAADAKNSPDLATVMPTLGMSAGGAMPALRH
jgi:hypothetical protein